VPELSAIELSLSALRPRIVEVEPALLKRQALAVFAIPNGLAY